MSVDTAEISKKGKSSKPPKRKVWIWLGYAVLAILLIIIIIFLILWDKRYEIAERYAQTILRDQGIEASLSIERLTREAVILNDVKLVYQNEVEPFFSAKRIEADYLLKDAMNGKMKRLRFVEPKADITLDKNFQITDGWLPPQESESTGGVSIPENGLFLEEASFSLTTPYGSPEIAVTANVRATDQFDATVIISPAELNYNAWTAEGSARLDLNVAGNVKDIEALVRMDRLSGQGLNLTEATLEIDGQLLADTDLPLDLETLDLNYDGDVSGRAENLRLEAFNFEESLFDWRGKISRETSSDQPIGVEGELALSTKVFSFNDAQRAKEVAETLTLSEALSKTPIAQHFSPSVTRSIERLVQRPSIDTLAQVKISETGSSVSLKRPLKIVQNRNELLVETSENLPLYQWSRAENEMALQFDASLKQPVPMTLEDTHIVAKSDNGWQLQGITNFKSNVKTDQTWRVTAQNEVARLAPFKGRLNYNVNDSDRRLRVLGGVDFDGRLPGGYVTGLKTRGEVDLNFAPSGQSGLALSYSPVMPEIKIVSLLTDTDWRLDNIAFDLEDANRVFVLRGDKADIEAGLKNVSFEASNMLDERSLSMRLEQVESSGILNTSNLSQSWLFDFNSADMVSDSVPMEGTKVTVPDGRLSVLKDEEIAFAFQTESLDANVPQGSVSGLKLSVEGTLDNYTATHSGGIFTSQLADVPNWPVTGQVEFKDEEFTGRATALIPEARNTPITVDYVYGDGEGRANVVLESLIFTQGGLQPQTLAPALSGKIAAVEGEVSADLKLRYVTGLPLESEGVLSVKNMNFGTAPGPVTGLNTDIQLTSLLPLQTAGRQILTVENFDPGFPLENGTVEYELVSNGVKIYDANWPIGAGAFALDPFTWVYGADENRVVMRLNEIPIEEFLNSVGNGKLEATGTVRGEFPIVVRGLNVLVDKGYLEAKDGGVIRYAADEGTAVTYSQEEALDIIRLQDSPQYRSLARDALREFTYRELTAAIDGPLDGDVQLGVIFDGTNKKVLNGQPFEFDIDVQGELFNILRSFNSNAQIKSEILRKQAEQAGLE